MGFTPKAIFDKQLIVGNKPNMLKTPVRWRGELWDFAPSFGPRPRDTPQDHPAGVSPLETSPMGTSLMGATQQETGS